MSDPQQDEKWIARALALARAGVGLASPNPNVGAVVLDAEGRMAGEGTHTYAGVKHAEVLALEQAGERARGGTLYLNLEPCSHHGRTGPCADAVLAAGVKRVVAAMQDPNPAVGGRGFARLREAGVEVTIGVCEREARKLNKAFAKWVRTGLPFVTLKSATSREGFIAPLDRTRMSFTGAEANAFVQDLRHANDAIVVGVGTVLADDPLLTDRSGRPRRRPLQRVVLDSRLRIPLTSQLVTSAADDVIVFCCDEPANRAQGTGGREQGTGNRELDGHRAQLEQSGVRVEVVSAGAGGRVDLRQLLERLGREKILSVSVEGGAEVNRGVLQSDLADKVILLRSPKALKQGLHWTGGATFDEAKAVETNEHRFGDDTATEFYIHNPYA